MDVASSDVMAALPPQVTVCSLPQRCWSLALQRSPPAQFRSFQAGDIDELKRLFALWFPVSYNDVRDAASVCVGTQC